MSGHSKWATTKRKKEATDAKRSKIFAKHAKLVTIAARDGNSGDPNMNPSLRMATDNAKAVSMPKENIDRAISRGVGESDAKRLEEITYEAFGPERSAFLIECLTDNKNRALSEVKGVLTKNDGNMVPAGNVSFLFEKKGEVVVDCTKNSIESEELEMAAIDAGAEDIESDEDFVFIYTNFKDLNKVKKSLLEQSIIIDTAELTNIASISIDIENTDTIEKIMELLDDLDDVNKVYVNVNFDQ